MNVKNPTKHDEVKSSATEGYVVSAPLVTPVM